MTAKMPERIGLICGAGEFPILLAKGAVKAGHEVITVGFKGITPPDIEQYSAKTEYFRLGRINAPIQFFKKNGARRIMMAGNVPHVSIFGGIMPDLRAIRLLASLKDKRANSLLSSIVDELKKDGLEMISSAEFLPEMLAKEGLVCGKPLTQDEKNAAAYGWEAAKALATLDIGLTVVLREKIVYAAEGQEGTDRCILRAGDLMRQSGDKGRLMVVKVARPKQDMRFDLPVAGIQTLNTMREAGAGILVVEAEKTLIFNPEDFIKEAERAGITVFAAKDKESFAN